MSVSERPATHLWREALAQLDDLLQLSPLQRQQNLTSLAQSEPQLHSILVSLIEAAARAESEGFLEPPQSPIHESLRPGAQLGAYRVLSPLGSGGMGEVWLARRDDGLYEGEVAIKTLHSYLGGGVLRERFLREAHILGRLSHPNIARLLDAGTATDGSVYLVLEYIRGIAIDQWCDEHRLTIDARLRMFLDVCAAVARAHANLVVHRDIKPSNMLVTDDGRVKLLDFGVAKLLESNAPPERTELTRITGRIFTPEYAAPEQILGEPVTTATDVYALGVLLHVLLTAARPYGNSGHRVEIERAVLHDEPLPPSRAVSTANVQQVATARSTTPARLQRALAGDLDNIVARALRKNPSERYASVLALAEDLQRHLQHKPILAQPEPLLARAKKFVRRHRVAVSASAIVASVLAAGVVAVVWQAQVARTEARKATAIRDFLVGIFERNSVAHPDGARARRTTAEELLSQSSKQIREALRDAPEVRGEMLGIMAQLYSTLDLQRDAIALLQDQLETERAHYGAVSLPVAKTLGNLSYSQTQIGEYAQAEQTAREAVQMFTALGDASTLEHGIALGTLAQAAYRMGRGHESNSRGNFEAALRLIATHHPRNKWRIEMLLGLSRMANLEGKLEQSLQYCRDAVALLEANAVDADGIVRGSVYQSTGSAFHWLSRYDEAEHHMQRAVVAYEQAGGPEHPFAVEGKRELGVFLTWTGRREEAKRLLTEVVAAQERAKGPDDPEVTAYARAALGQVLVARGEFDAAEPQLVRAAAVWKANKHPVWQAISHLSRMLIAQGRLQEAETWLAGVEAPVIETWGKGSWAHATAVTRIGQLQFAQGKLDAAAATFDRVWNEWQEAPDALNANRANARLGRIRVHLSAREFDQALQLAKDLLPAIERSVARPDLKDEEAAAHMLLGVALRGSGEPDAAKLHLERAVAMREKLDAPESPWLAEARRCLTGC